MFKLSVEGSDQINKNLSRKLEEIESKNGSAPLREVINQDFLSKHTRFISLDEMFRASGFKVDNQQDLEALPKEELDLFIRSISTFESWKVMLNEAGMEWMKKILNP